MADSDDDMSSVQNNTAALKRPLPSCSSRDPRKFSRMSDQVDSAESPDWQTVPLLRKKPDNKQIHNQSKMNLDNNITITNKFSVLPIDVIDETENVKKNSKPPPIMLYGITDVVKLSQLFATTVSNTDYAIRTISNKNIKIMANNVDSYKKLIALIRKENLIGHTFTCKEDKAYRVVLKNLHFSTPADIIREELLKHGHVVRGQIINARHRQTKTPLSTFFINLEPNTNNNDIFNIKFISNYSVKFEVPRKSNNIPQCMRCQQYGHTKNNCMRPYRCVKCAEAHNSTDCPKLDRTKPATCALCLADHPANYKGCQVYQEIIQRKMKNRQPEILNRRKTQVQFRNNSVDFPPLLHQTPRQSSGHTSGPVGTKTTTLNHPRCSYADSLNLGNINEINSYASPTQSNENTLDERLNRISSHIEILIQQMGNLMGLLTTVVQNLCK